MKHTLALLFFLACITRIFATQQQTDLLIVEKDTFHLKTFPLENLKFTTRPFGNTRRTAPSTSCWRGYRAVWKIEDNKLYLEKIIRCNYDSKTTEQDIKELFDLNGIKCEEKDGMILADWLTMSFYKLSKQHFPNRICLAGADIEKGDLKDKSLKLKIENGKVKLNRLEE